MSSLSTRPVTSPSAVDAGVLRWWRALRGLAVLNVCLLLVAWRFAPIAHVLGAWQLGLSAIYVLVCAYRSALPRVDLERLVVVDSPLSSIFLGRSAATVAEVCFGLQLGLLVHHLGARAGLPAVETAAWAIPVFTLIAQAFCWHSVLTLNHITQAVESCLWAAGAGWMAVLLACVASRTIGTLHVLAGLGVALCIAYVGYLLLVDVPMYVRRYREGKAAGRRYLGLAEGLRDAWARREPSHSWARWKDDVRWLTPYFSAGAWISMALVFVPHA